MHFSFQKLFVFQIFEFPLEIGLCAECTFWEIFEHSGSSTFLGKKSGGSWALLKKSKFYDILRIEVDEPYSFS